MDIFLHTEFRQHPEVAPHITLYLFEHRAPRVEVLSLKERVEEQANISNKTEKRCKDLRNRVDLITEKANRLSQK